MKQTRGMFYAKREIERLHARIDVLIESLKDAHQVQEPDKNSFMKSISDAQYEVLRYPPDVRRNMGIKT